MVLMFWDKFRVLISLRAKEKARARGKVKQREMLKKPVKKINHLMKQRKQRNYEHLMCLQDVEVAEFILKDLGGQSLFVGVLFNCIILCIARFI